MTAAATSLGDRVAALDWHHLLELPGGVATRGHSDPRDVGTWDGIEALPSYGVPHAAVRARPAR